MSRSSATKRRSLEIPRRPEGGAGETRPVVVSPADLAGAKRDVVATLHHLIDTLTELRATDQEAQLTDGSLSRPLLLNAIEAGKLLSVSRSKVLELAARGEIPCIRIGGSVRIPRDRRTTWIDDRTRYAIAGPLPRIPAWAHANRGEEV
jgi:excisionase family DNA binding protein